MAKRFSRRIAYDYPSTNYPRNAETFNHLEKGIDDIDNAVEDVQNQVNALVISGDSTPAIAQALAGTEFSTLKEYRENNDSLLAQNVNRLKTATKYRRFIFIGDSYLHGSGTNNGWLERLVPMLGLTEGVDYYQNGVGGYSFGGVELNFLSLLMALYDTITDKASITDIVVLGGANEVGFDPNDIGIKIDAFVTYAKANYPNAVISIGFIGGTRNYEFKGTQYARALAGYSSASNRGIVFLKNLQYVLNNISYIGSDTIHPTQEVNGGYDNLANNIYDTILTGSCSVQYDENTMTKSIIAPIAGTTIASAECHVNVNNDLTTVSFGATIDISFTTPISVSLNTAISVLEFCGNLVLGTSGQNNATFTPHTAVFHSTVNNLDYIVQGYSYISGRRLYFVPYDSILGTTGAFASCDRLRLVPKTFTVNSMFI